MTHSLVKKAGKGVAWNVLAQIIQQVIRFLVMVILARIINPSDFGVFAMVLVFTEFIQPFREWGFQAALIQKEKIDSEYQNTAFWSICSVGVLFYLVSLCCANWIGSFFNNSLVAKIIPIMGISFLISPFGSIQWAMLTRELKFNVIAIRDTVAMFFYGIVAITLALKGFGVWSLVVACLAREFLWALFFLAVYKWRPLFQFTFAKFKELLNFCINCTGVGILNTLINNVDNLFVGKFLGATNLGFYNLAFNTVSQPQTRLVSQIGKVAFPAYSQIQSDNERLKSAYLKTIKIILMAVLPALSILLISARDFVLVFYGEKWLTAVVPIQIMCFYGLVRGLTSVTGTVFLSKGRPDIDFKISIVRIIVFIIFLLAGLRYGIIGVSVAVLLYSLCNFFPTFYFANKLIKVNQAEFYAGMYQYLIFALFIIMGIWGSNLFLSRYFQATPLINLVLNSLTGLFIYLSILFFFRKNDFNLAIQLFKKIIS